METRITRTHKDRLFRMLFADPDHRQWTLSLYNAVNETAYTDVDAIQINTIEDVLFMGMKNDLSFIIDDCLSIYEHQSTPGANMPVRMLFYVSMLYSKYYEEKKLNLYSERLNVLPSPSFVVFYNGTKEMEDRKILRFTDAVPEGRKSAMELNVLMLNINYGRNKELMNSSRPLADYAFLIDNIRRYVEKTGDPGEAASLAIKALPEDSPLKGFLVEHEAEVRMRIMTEYNEQETMDLFRKEWHEEGREEGLIEGMSRGESRLAALVTKLKDCGREADVFKAASDSAYRDSLYREFGLI